MGYEVQYEHQLEKANYENGDESRIDPLMAERECHRHELREPSTHHKKNVQVI